MKTFLLLEPHVSENDTLTVSEDIVSLQIPCSMQTILLPGAALLHLFLRERKLRVDVYMYSTYMDISKTCSFTSISKVQVSWEQLTREQ